MEAASSTSQPLLARDGGAPIAPAGPEPTVEHLGVPISGACECSACKRTLLIGEAAFIHRKVARNNEVLSEAWICELCEHKRVARRAGRAVRRERVRSLGGAMNVRRRNPVSA